MRIFRRREPFGTPDRERLLRGHPIRNEAITWEDRGEYIRVTVPRTKSWKARLLSILFIVPRERVFELDAVGSEVVRLCDGKKTVRKIADHLAETLKLNRREAEAALLGYLSMLVKRGIVGVAIPERRSRKR